MIYNEDKDSPKYYIRIIVLLQEENTNSEVSAVQKDEIPASAEYCCAALRAAGFQAYPVGGCVRDLLLGRQPGDWDVTTSARPEQVEALFPRTVPTGKRHGTITVLTGAGAVEVTTFRKESGYADGRHPDGVDFDADLAADLSRRDFTINAMALSPEGEVIDPFGGRADLERRLIRCVGAAERRFSEDALRMFRALRFSAQLGFQLEEETAAAIRACAAGAERLSSERVRQELEKILCSPRPALAREAFALGLMTGRAAGAPGELDALARLPEEPMLRWAGLCAALLESGAIAGARPFLGGLRVEGRVLRACAAGEELWRAGLPGDDRSWRHALARCGADGCRAAAAMGEMGARPGALDALAAVLTQKPCVTVDALALSGGEIAALGLTGPAIGAAQRALLAHVLDHPEDNAPAALRARLHALVPGP